MDQRTTADGPRTCASNATSGAPGGLLAVPRAVLVHMCDHWLPLPAILGLRLTCRTLGAWLQVVAESKVGPGCLCASGKLEALQMATVTVEAVRQHSLLGWACHGGHMEVARWLVHHYDLTAEDARAGSNRALRYACNRGHLDVARWLTDRFALTAENARSCGNCAIRFSAGNGHLEVVRWLVNRFKLTAEDIRANDNEALRYACWRGHLDVARWLTDRFALTRKDARAENGALQWACRGGHVEVVQWLVGRFKLRLKDVQSNNYWALRAACNNDAHEAGRWLVHHFGIKDAPRIEVVMPIISSLFS